MAHISSLSAGIFTYLDLFNGTIPAGTDTSAEFAALFVGTVPGTPDATHIRVPSVREFPSVGTPANIVNIPVYGQSISSQVQGQADAPSLEVTVNYIPEDMTAISDLIGTGEMAFRFMMAASAVTPEEGSDTTLAVANTEFYVLGKVEAVLVNPNLTDSNTAVITLSAAADFVGPATIAAV